MELLRPNLAGLAKLLFEIDALVMLGSPIEFRDECCVGGAAARQHHGACGVAVGARRAAGANAA